MALERHLSDYRSAHGQGDEPALASGRFLQLREHPREDWNDLWLVTQVRHEGKQPQVLEEAVTEEDGGELRQGYRNTFVGRAMGCGVSSALAGAAAPDRIGVSKRGGHRPG